MAARHKPTWIAVLDGAQARFFALRKGDDGQIFEEAAPALNADLSREDRGKPGRAFASAGGGLRHAVEPRSNARKLEKHNFAREVAEALDAALAERRYDRLVLVAPPRSLGELRELLSARVRACTSQEVPKDLTKLAPAALWEKLSAHLLQAATLPNGAGAPATAKANGGSVPLSIVFRNMEASVSVQAGALRHAAKLERKYGRIVSCRVTVEAPPLRQRKGRLFRATVELLLPGREISAKSADESRHAHEDATAALRDAFAAAERQLQDHVRRISAPRGTSRAAASQRE